MHVTTKEAINVSKLAASLADVNVAKPKTTPKTPCFPIYGYGDQEDYEAIHRLRENGAEWVQVQVIVDEALNVSEPIENRKFIRHWRAQCSCWQ
jgi:hypothetical protein